jgi:2-oxoglutarate ferredoxin oxidoreductase subunit beta
MLAQLPSAAYIERVSVHDVGHILKAKKAIKKAFEYQVNGKGFTMVEVLGSCPIGWKITPVEGNKFIVDGLMPYYPLGLYCDRPEGKAPQGGSV